MATQTTVVEPSGIAKQICKINKERREYEI